MFGHIILIATFLHLSYIYVCHLKWLCPDIWAHSIPVGDSLSCCMPRLLWTSSPGAAARARPQCTWNHSTLWKLRMQTTHRRGMHSTDGPWVRSDAARESKGSVKWCHTELLLQWYLQPCQQSQCPLGLEPRTLSVGVFSGELWQFFFSKVKEREMITQQGMRRPL